jgi:hypothetical protein
MIDLNNITIGSDPEFGIINKKTGAPMPSFLYLNGTKEAPEDKGNGFAILKDNVLAEGNIPPAKSKREFISYMKELKNILNIILGPHGAELKSADTLKYAPRFLKNNEANLFGCSAYKNAWKDGEFSAEDMSKFRERTIGYHIHVGYNFIDASRNSFDNKMEFNKHIARAYDYFVTYPSRLHHNDPFRAKYYGIYGAYRDTSYGLEVRSLGGYFTQDKYLGWVYDNTIKAIEFCCSQENIDKLDELADPDSSDIKSAYTFLGLNLDELQIHENF